MGRCLHSLVSQSADSFVLGRDWELIVVDDASTDGTRAVALGVEGVRVLEAPALDFGVFTGKNNACRALEEISERKVGLLSYSPRQIVRGFWQRALMPLVFSELASVYPTKLVNDVNNENLLRLMGNF